MSAFPPHHKYSWISSHARGQREEEEMTAGADMSGLGFSSNTTREAGSEESGRTMMFEHSLLPPLD
jgi:hypothetical protein